MVDIYSKIAWLIPVLPLASFLLLTAMGKSFHNISKLLSALFALASLILSALLLVARSGSDAVDYSYSYEWIVIGDFTLRIGYEVTNLTTLMLAVVSLVSFLIQVYSMGYMSKDERITVFYGYVSLFTFSMLGLVLADNLLTFYIFWELVGVCSFLLIGFWYSKPAARAAAKKAFVVTRIGDAGLLLGIILLFWHMPEHALSFTLIQSIFEGGSGAVTEGMTTLIALLLFMGAVGKSGQFPLHVWLPDAMEGPTPISALIHAATMVAAGVFLVARTFSLFQASEAAMTTVAYVGGFTALLAATIALAQKDMKRILAYSTMSQLGFMMLALGLGSLAGGIFHLFTHAFFKALLFLGAGSVIMAIHTGHIGEMGGLGRRMKVTAWTFAIGGLALAGMPPLAGFWSKDVILAAALEKSPVLFIAAIAAAFLTALYMTRLFVLVFMGKPRGGMAAEGVKESPLVMVAPMLILALLAVAAGWLETPWQASFSGWLFPDEPEAHGSYVAMLISTVVALLGLLLGWQLYGRGRQEGDVLVERMPGLMRVLEKKYYIDEIYGAVFGGLLRSGGLILAGFDKYVVGGTIAIAGTIASYIGKTVLKLQNGQIGTYSLAIVVGIIIFVVVTALRRLLL
ncbi:NADH-quinone oxidoreductase subunit L [Paenibacillus chungangensis]|uniref:NADH-quinone oxidoreductase subunit L n=1 Tax=Paenibacillus chungangensis TaxID=696535 RepID=A0ABW3HK54_9BACL